MIFFFHYRFISLFQLLSVYLLMVICLNKNWVKTGTLMCLSLLGYHSTDVLLLICRGLHGKLGA
ncbi:hypothetical protein CS535_04800 [Yersinia massiliensis]|nr:hypothetical protein CRN74_11470 [Yersinia frederiksenii]OWF75180.1 hypothetical protein B4902_03600 [Yersinia frederiksenii]PHZ24893.1 hypothetical protein CS535_04800 [Yersinia massiliensis]